MTVAVSEDPPFIISESNQNFQFLDTIEGLEQHLLSNIGRLVNISIDYIMVPPHVRYGFVLEDGSYTGSLVYLQNKTAEIVAGAFILIKNRAEVLDFITGYNFPTIKVYTSAHKEGTWKSVYKPFGQTTWALIILSYIVFSTVIIVLSYLITGNNDYMKTLLRVLGYFYGNVDNNLIRVTKLRRFIIIWIIFALLTCAFYNTALYSVITGKKTNITPVIDKQYISFLTPCITETILTFFKYTYNETLVTDDSPNCRYIETALDTVAKSSNLYTIYLDYSYKFGEYKYIDKDGNQKLDTWDYSSHYMLAMYASKGFPLFDVFCEYVQRFFESGLTEKHLNDIYFKSQLLKVNPVRKFVAVTLSDCRIHFGVLLFGVVLSVMCFVIELNKKQINYAT
ncbi:glutamate receptor ionotropic, delta-2-like [Aricia agestis]|uniref:glutamate receptor ionotropic, delta-2-like n=1 Tax=Aricia agestis TaxID=91739 RepID=UPI001C2033FC|nr:glutamate receptor ionotropic, delta-2-like [Aricia agestis]